MKQQLTRWQCFAKKFSETEGKDKVLLNVILLYGYICAEEKLPRLLTMPILTKRRANIMEHLLKMKEMNLSEE